MPRHDDTLIQITKGRKLRARSAAARAAAPPKATPRGKADIKTPTARTTIRPIILSQKLKLKTDIRLRERDNAGRGSNTPEMFRRRWNDFDYHEAGGESLRSTQDRNIAAVSDILHEFTDKTVLIGTHGTALAVILNYYDPSFGLNGFLRMIDFMPCIIRMTFDGAQLSEQKELFYIKKEFHGVTD